jgi:cell division septation protein DedD
LRTITEGVNLGAAGSSMNPEVLLTDALAGMDDALLKAVEANQVALQQLTDGGAGFEDSKIKKALDELERYEDTLLNSVKQASAGATDKIREQWSSVLKNSRIEGTDTGAQVAAMMGQYGAQFQAAIRNSRTAGFKVAHAMTRNYSTLVSGVLIGLSEALQQRSTGSSPVASATSAKPAAEKPAAKPAAKKAAATPAAKKTAASKPAAKKSAAKKSAAKKKR